MDVVVGAADGVREDCVIFTDGGDEGPEVRLKVMWDGFAAIFGAEDDVESVLRVGVGHGRFRSVGGRGFESGMCGVGRGFLRTRLVSHLRRWCGVADAPRGVGKEVVRHA
jgi:hypothetical protein